MAAHLIDAASQHDQHEQPDDIGGKDKKFQMLVVEDIPEFIRFLSKKESGSFKQNTIYVCRGTSCEIANEEEI